MRAHRSGALLAAAIALAGLAGSACTSRPAPVAAPATAPASVRTVHPTPSAGATTPPAFPYADETLLPRGPVRVTSAVSRAVRYLDNKVNGYPDWNRRFAGSWIGSDGKSLSVAITRAYYPKTAPALASYMHRHYPTVAFHTVEVARSTSDLEALQHQIYTFVYGPGGDLNGKEISLAAVGTITQTNQLNAQLIPGHDDVAARIRAHFGNLVVITDNGQIATSD